MPRPEREGGSAVQDEGSRNTGKRWPQCPLLVGQYVEPGFECHRGNGLTGSSGTGTQPSRRCQNRHERLLKTPAGGSRSTARKLSSDTRESSQRTSSTLPRAIICARNRRPSARVWSGGCHQTYFLAMACARQSFASRLSSGVRVALKSTSTKPTRGELYMRAPLRERPGLPSHIPGRVSSPDLRGTGPGRCSIAHRRMGGRHGSAWECVARLSQ